MKRKRILRKIRLIFCVIAAFLGLGWGIAAFYRSDPDGYIPMATTNPLITDSTCLCAHRSGGGVYPEESLPAFRNCAESAAFRTDYFEFDLHLTRDGCLVLMHDDSLDRTTDSRDVFGESGVYVRDKTLGELKTLNIGAKFVTDDGKMPYRRYSGENVPDDLRILTLGEALDYLTGIDRFRYIIEIKDGGEDGLRAADLLYEELSDRELLESAIVCSFHDEVLAYVDEHYPDVMRGAGVGEALEFLAAVGLKDRAYAPACSAVQLPYGDPAVSDFLNLGLVGIVNYAHANNVAVQYWTVNDAEDMRYLKSIHVDVIMTDYPERLAEVLGK